MSATSVSFLRMGLNMVPRSAWTRAEPGTPLPCPWGGTPMGAPAALRCPAGSSAPGHPAPAGAPQAPQSMCRGAVPAPAGI